MKIISRTILCLFFSGYCLFLSAQNIGNHSIGLQLNPYIDEFLFTGTFIKPVYAFRYSLGIKDHISIGPELSGSQFKAYSNDYSVSNLNIGGFFRYSFFPSSRIKPFIEASPYYTFQSWKNAPIEGFGGLLEPNGSKSYLSGYVAPGISLYSKSKKISLDLFYKFSNKSFVNGKHSVLSYRLNYNF
jgi:hypothetical protein